VFFNEPITTPLVLGVMLTIAGVMTIGSARE
jgi:multidrug transporter EmrE-like cation transporter